MKATFGERRLVHQVTMGILSIDRYGKVWRHSVGRNNGTRATIKVRLADCGGRREYLRVHGCFNGTRLTVSSHRLVWKWLFGDIPEGLEINHRNGIKHDNRPGNLELVTSSENNVHAFRVLGTRNSEGEHHSQHKLTNDEVIAIRKSRSDGVLLRVLAEQHKVSEATISLVARGLHWSHLSSHQVKGQASV